MRSASSGSLAKLASIGGGGAVMALDVESIDGRFNAVFTDV